MAEQSNPLNAEIAQLEQKLAAKKQELMQSGVETPEKHVLKEVIREHAFAKEAPAAASPIPSPRPQTQPARSATPAEEAQINAFVATAFVSGIPAAVAAARKTGNAFLIDMLHDRLADEYYAKLVASRKIKPA